MRIVQFYIALLLIECLVFSNRVSAERINVVTEYFPPFQLTNEQGKLDGYATEVVHELFKLTKDQAHIQLMPWARAYVTALNSPNTMIFTMAHTEIRQPLFNWVGAISQERLFFWGLKSRYPRPVANEQALRQLSIATSRGSNPEQYLTKQGFNKLHRVVEIDQGIAMLFAKRVDLLMGSAVDMPKRAKKLGYDFTQMVPVYEIEALNHELCIAFNLNSQPKLVQRYKAAFKQLQKNGTISALKQKWHIDEQLKLNAKLMQ